jgi:4-hydroxy-2-oxoheptanedioate aldolase
LRQPPAGPQPTPLRGNPLKSKLCSRDFVVGTFVQIPSPPVVELLGFAGFDFVVLDCEHGPIDRKETENLIRAALSTEISVVVRPPACEPLAISQPLDWGAAGVQVPQIASSEMARLVVRSSKYHPLGMRGLQPYVRAASYRSYGTAEYLANANRETLIVAQVEGTEGIANLESILQVEGLDVAFIGPYDLSQSLGLPAQIAHPRVQEAMSSAVRLAAKTGKLIGTYCDDVETAIRYRNIGVRYLTVSIDSYILLSGARSVVSKLKPDQASLPAIT